MYQLQEEAPTPVAVPSTKIDETICKPAYFGEEYHSYVSHDDSKLLLSESGQYLVRESGKNRKHHTLSLRFLDEIKHYRYRNLDKCLNQSFQNNTTWFFSDCIMTANFSLGKRNLTIFQTWLPMVLLLCFSNSKLATTYTLCVAQLVMSKVLTLLSTNESAVLLVWVVIDRF